MQLTTVTCENITFNKVLMQTGIFFEASQRLAKVNGKRKNQLSFATVVPRSNAFLSNFPDLKIEMELQFMSVS